ncbi:hypothetical protein [Bifidobacterium sp.]|jgi:hypothetical protein|uniref:hypothetical protein n=1 Tax=Bifidobacterium sp. TaxID=41200 RepID=UPI0025BE37D2|nr:hypothetical protein [Bifidobacterium sp.]MCI1635106.1 hypothetical protein [Bifidobacterium sp.]
MDGKAQEKIEDSTRGAPSRRSRLMRGVVTPVLGLLAVACIVLGIMNATVWKPSSNISANTQVSSRYITTDPGVLNLVDNSVNVTLRTSNAQAMVCMALGYAQDVSGWLAGSSYARITGLDSWSTLAKRTSSAGADGSSENAVAFQDSDMWTRTECATGSVSMRITNSSANTVLIADTDASSTRDAQSQGTQQLTMSWVRTDLPNFAMPLYFSGGLLAVLAVITASVFAMEPERRRKRQVEEREEKEPEITVLQAFTGTLSPIGRSIRSAVTPKPKDTRHRRQRTPDTQSVEVEPSEASETLGTPKIIDAGSRNMVADQQHAHSRRHLPSVSTAVESVEQVEGDQHNDGDASTHGRAEHTGRRTQRDDRTSRRALRAHTAQTDSATDNTTVISNDDLASFFARLSAEDAVPSGVEPQAEASANNSDTHADAAERQAEEDDQ